MIEFHYVILTDNTAQIGENSGYNTGCVGDLPSFVVIPSHVTIEGTVYKIVSISQHAFLRQHTVETVYIPSTIEY